MWWLGHLRVALSLPSMKMTMRMRVEQQWAMVSDSTLVLPLSPAAAPPKSLRLHALSRSALFAVSRVCAPQNTTERGPADRLGKGGSS